MEQPKTNRKLPAFMKTLRFSTIVIGLLGLVITVLFAILIQRSLFILERELMGSRLKADLVCLLDDLTADGEGVFSLRDDGIYLDNRLLGDGSEETAVLEDFQHYEDKTGTFCYLFAKTDNDDELHWVEDGGYMQGHYIRIAGTTRGPKGERIEGTYIDKKVADEIEASSDGILICEANVNGRPVYCCYQLIRDTDGNIIGILSDGRSTVELKQEIWDNVLIGILVTILLTSFITCFMLRFTKRIISNIQQIRDRLSQIGEGKLTEPPLVLQAENEFHEIAESVNDMSRSLADRERIRSELSEVKKDLNLATEIQRNMLTRKTFEGETRFSVFAYMDPAREVGGDFYDYFLTDDTHLAFLIADVSGKGIPAALFMMRSITTLRNSLFSKAALEDIIKDVNNNLFYNNEERYFITAWVGILDLTSGVIRYVNAGHTTPLLKKASGETVWIRSKGNMMLGAMPNRTFKTESMTVSPGDTMYLYTDGVTEAHNSEDQMYREAGLESAAAIAPAGAKALCETVLSGLETFCGDAEQFDDITMLAATFHG